MVNFLNNQNIDIIINLFIAAATILTVIPQFIDKKRYEDLFYAYKDKETLMLVRLLHNYEPISMALLFIVLLLPLLISLFKELLHGNIRLFLFGIPKVGVEYYVILIITIILQYLLRIVFYKIIALALMKPIKKCIRVSELLFSLCLLGFSTLLSLGAIFLLDRPSVGLSDSALAYISFVCLLNCFAVSCMALQDYVDDHERYLVKNVVITLENNNEIIPVTYDGEYNNMLVTTDIDGNVIHINKDMIVCTKKAKKQTIIGRNEMGDTNGQKIQ